MSFDLKISLDDGGAASTLDKVTSGLENTENASKKATGGMTELAAALGLTTKATAATASGADRVTEALDRVGDRANKRGVSIDEYLAFSQGAMDRTLAGIDSVKASLSKMYPQSDLEAQVHSLDALLVQSQISVEQYDAQISKLYAALGKSGAGTPMSDELKAQDDLLKSIKGPAQQYATQMTALENLFAQGKINAAEFDTTLARLNQKFGAVQGSGSGGMSSELERQAQIFQRINAPMLEYEAQLKALDALLRQDKISLTDYNRELERAEAAARKGAGPIQGPQRPGATGGGGGSDDTDPSHSFGSGLNSANMLLAGGAVGMGITQLGQQIESLVHNYQDIQDVAIQAANAVQRFTDASHSTNLVIDQQMQLANQLHATYTQTVNLYGRLAEEATEMGLSNAEATTLTKEFGEAVQLTGRSIESADGIARRFAFSMGSGKIETREMRSIMREMPAIAKLWENAFHATGAQIMQMTKDGRISVEDLVSVTLRGNEEIDKSFQKLTITHKQTSEQWLEDEKILSQRNDVGFGTGHAAQGAIDSMAAAAKASAAGYAEIKRIAETNSLAAWGNDQVKFAKAALEQIDDQQKAAIADFIEDAKNLTGAFRPLGDAYRQWIGDTAAVRAEVTKINEPIAAARTELVTLNKAFATGKIDVDSYTKKWTELQTTIGHGIGPQALKITEPIRIARAELDRLNSEIEAGANVSQAQYRKALSTYETAMHSGATPEDLKLNVPKEDAADAMADLIARQKEGRITAEAYRREYDALITTMNDGRLPAVIKVWESFTLPLRDWREELGALTTLFEGGRISLLKYTDEIGRAAAAGSKYTHEQVEDLLMTDELRKRLQAQVHTALGGNVLVTPDAREQFDRYQAYRQQQERDRRSVEASANGAKSGFGPGVTSFDSVSKSLDEMRPGADAGQEWKNFGDQLERAHQLMLEFEAPGVTLQNTLRDIDVAAHTYALTQEQVNALQIRAKDAYFSQTEALRVVKGPLDEYEATLRKLGHQAEENAISQQKYTDSVRAARITFLEASGAGKTFTGGMEVEWIKMQQEADAFGASVAHLVVEDFGKLNDALVTAANGGKVAWGQMADAMIQDLERIALKMLEVKALSAIFDAISPGSGAAVGAAAGIAHSATGMDGIIQGPGGTDSRLFASWVTPGERVTITPPGAYPWPSGGSGPGAAAQPTAQRAPVVNVHNHYDSSVGLATIDSRQGNQAVLNVLRANGGAVRSYSGTRR